MRTNPELPIIQKCYDLILWFVPIINRFPRSHKFVIGDRIQTNLLSILEGLIGAKFGSAKRDELVRVNTRLDVLRYQARLLLDLKLIDAKRFSYVSSQIKLSEPNSAAGSEA